MIWFGEELRKGLAALYLLRLPSAPSPDEFPGSVNVWITALTLERSWEKERDVERIQTAFTRLSLDAVRWPTPREFLQALPAAPTRLKLGKPEKHEPSPHAQACMAEIAAMNSKPAAWEQEHFDRTGRWPDGTLRSATRRALPERYTSKGPSPYATGTRAEDDDEALEPGDDPDLPVWLQERNDPHHATTEDPK